MNDKERLVELLKERLVDPVICCMEICDCCPHGDCAGGLADHLIDNDVTVQKHGRWVMKDTAYACSECGCGFVAPASYCFSCGAKMMEDNHD